MELNDLNQDKRKNNEILRFGAYDLFSNQKNNAFIMLKIWGDDWGFDFNESLL